MFYFRFKDKRVAVNLDYRLETSSSGKWVIYGKRGYIGSLFKTAREFVKKGELYEVKFMKRDKRKYALLVYADKYTQDNFLGILKNLSLNPRWVSNSQTRLRKKLKGLVGKITLVL